MKRVTFDEARKIVESRGLKPARLKGTEVIAFVKEYGTRYVPLTWDEVKKLIEESGSELYDSNGWIRIV
jgi:hypothetical protein